MEAQTMSKDLTVDQVVRRLKKLETLIEKQIAADAKIA
jgi:hypothetical protein